MAILFAPDSVFLQRFLRAGDYYRDDIDGILGNLSKSALERFTADGEHVRSELGAFEKRSEGTIATMLIPTQRAARKFLLAANQGVLTSGLSARLISGTRTYAEQDALYAQGRTKPGNKVTNARAGQSNHNFGIAWDVGIFTGSGAYIDQLADQNKMTSAAVEAEYKKLGPIGRNLGLFWGGDWSKPDRPHYQLLDNDQLPMIRERFLSGGKYV